MKKPKSQAKSQRKPLKDKEMQNTVTMVTIKQLLRVGVLKHHYIPYRGEGKSRHHRHRVEKTNLKHFKPSHFTNLHISSIPDDMKPAPAYRRKPDGDRRTVRVTALLTPAEAAKVRIDAAMAGISTSKHIAESLISSLRPIGSCACCLPASADEVLCSMVGTSLTDGPASDKQAHRDILSNPGQQAATKERTK